MTPIEFEQQTMILAKDQPQYTPLPVYIDYESRERTFISCHQLSWVERWALLFTGRLWHSQMTFGNGYAPILMQVDSPWSKETSDAGENHAR